MPSRRALVAKAGLVEARARLAILADVWAELEDSDPDVVVAMPCGWDAARAVGEVESRAAEVGALGAHRVWAVDAAASFSRPGPRLVEGTELLARLLHPDRVRAPAGVPFEPVTLDLAGQRR